MEAGPDGQDRVVDWNGEMGGELFVCDYDRSTVGVGVVESAAEVKRVGPEVEMVGETACVAVFGDASAWDGGAGAAGRCGCGPS